MCNEFMAIAEQDGPWHIGYCAEVPEPTAWSTGGSASRTLYLA